MPTKSLEACVRPQTWDAIIDLEGEIDSFTEDALNAASVEAESQEANVILLKLSRVDYSHSALPFQLFSE